jgi:cytochrome P450
MQATAVIPARIDPPNTALVVYRERLHRRRLTGHDVLFVMDPALIRQVLVDEAESFEKGLMARRALEPLLGDAILIAEGARWRWRRRAAAPLFRREQLLNFLPVTRGKRLLVLVGQKKAIAIAVRNVSGRRRWSKLAEWLCPRSSS